MSSQKGNRKITNVSDQGEMKIFTQCSITCPTKMDDQIGKMSTCNTSFQTYVNIYSKIQTISGILFQRNSSPMVNGCDLFSLYLLSCAMKDFRVAFQKDT